MTLRPQPGHVSPGWHLYAGDHDLHASNVDAIRDTWSLAVRSHSWSSSERCPISTLTAVDTDTVFKMQDTKAADFEYPWLISRQATKVIVGGLMMIDVSRYDPTLIRIKAQTRTLVTAVTSANSAIMPLTVGDGFTVNTPAGWNREPKSGIKYRPFNFLCEVTPASLGTTRWQAIALYASYRPNGNNPYASTGDNAIALSFEVRLRELVLRDAL